MCFMIGQTIAERLCQTKNSMAMICLLAAAVHYIREVVVALSSVRNEANDSRFMDLGAPPEIRTHNPL